MSNNDEELTWAKLNGDWSNPNYRRSVAENGMCLDILAGDINRGVSGAANKKIIDNIMKEIMAGGV